MMASRGGGEVRTVMCRRAQGNGLWLNGVNGGIGECRESKEEDSGSQGLDRCHDERAGLLERVALSQAVVLYGAC